MNNNWQVHLKDYEQFERIGQGSFAHVFKATNKATKEFVAIKVISLRVHNHPDLRKLFQEEIKYLKALQGESIVKLVDILQTEEHILIITELCECDLQKLQDMFLRVDMNYTKFSLQASAIIIEQLATGIKRMHQLRVMHRDIKPQNILIKFDYLAHFDQVAGDELSLNQKLSLVDEGLRNGTIKIKLTDFGLSKEFQRTVMNSVAGSPAFMSPQVINSCPYNQMADIYSIFVTYWKLVTGILPVPNTNDLKVIDSKINSGNFFGENLIGDENLKQFLKKGLAYEAKDRPSINELLEYLMKVLRPVDDVPSYFKTMEMLYLKNQIHQEISQRQVGRNNLNLGNENELAGIDSWYDQLEEKQASQYRDQHQQHVQEQNQSFIQEQLQSYIQDRSQSQIRQHQNQNQSQYQNQNQSNIPPQAPEYNAFDRTVHGLQQQTFYRSLHNALNAQDQDETQTIKDFEYSFKMLLNSLEVLSELYVDLVQLQYLKDKQKFCVAYKIECIYIDLNKSVRDVRDQHKNAKQENLAILDQLKTKLDGINNKFKCCDLMQTYIEKAETLFQGNNDLFDQLHKIETEIKQRLGNHSDEISQSAYYKLISGRGEL